MQTPDWVLIEDTFQRSGYVSWLSGAALCGPLDGCVVTEKAVNMSMLYGPLGGCLVTEKAVNLHVLTIMSKISSLNDRRAFLLKSVIPLVNTKLFSLAGFTFLS